MHRPGFYAQRFQDFMAKTVFKKIPSRKYYLIFIYLFSLAYPILKLSFFKHWSYTLHSESIHPFHYHCVASICYFLCSLLLEPVSHCWVSWIFYVSNIGDRNGISELLSHIYPFPIIHNSIYLFIKLFIIVMCFF